MKHLNMSHPLAVIVFFLFLFYSLSFLHATEYYALRLAGSDCLLCHVDPGTGSLNRKGTLFQEEGYRYPISWEGILFYFVWGLTVSLILFGLYRRYRLWHLGKAEEKWSQWKERWRGLLIYGFRHRTILRSLFPGVSHLLLFWSFTILTVAITTVLIQEYLSFPLLGMRFFDFKTYPYLRLILDLGGMVGCTGTILFAYRRYIQRPKGLDHQPADTLSLLLIFFVFLTGFSLTGIRNHLYHSAWSSWAPVASTLARALTRLIKEESDLKIFFSILWWVHLFLSFTFLSLLPFSKLFHLFASPLNIFLRNLKVKGALSALDLETSETYGVGKMDEFTWKHLLDLDACTRCGRCQENCPAYLSDKALNPRGIIQKLKRHMEISPGRRNDLQPIREVVSEEETWDCTTCRNCLEHCPVFIEPMTKLLEFRRNLVLHHGKIPKETRFTFRNIERRGNPWGFDPEKRMWWTKELGVREIAPGDEAEVLLWVGCYGSYDDRNIKVTTSLIHILNKAGVNFGVLGNAEWCCGIDLRRMGNEYLFQINVKKNIDQLRQIRFRKILTTCPHCFNTLKNEYPQFGGTFEVIHYATFLEQLIHQGKVQIIPKDSKGKITYHDSCYLGRYNDGYDPPRGILKAMPDLFFAEMERSREKGFCCGGGGCHMWMEERVGRRINQMRVEQAMETGAQILATVCPLCMISLDSAVKVLKVLNVDDRIRVMDILGLVAERMKPSPLTLPSPPMGGEDRGEGG